MWIEREIYFFVSLLPLRTNGTKDKKQNTGKQRQCKAQADYNKSKYTRRQQRGSLWLLRTDGRRNNPYNRIRHQSPRHHAETNSNSQIGPHGLKPCRFSRTRPDPTDMCIKLSLCLIHTHTQSPANLVMLHRSLPPPPGTSIDSYLPVLERLPPPLPSPVPNTDLPLLIPSARPSRPGRSPPAPAAAAGCRAACAETWRAL